MQKSSQNAKFVSLNNPPTIISLLHSLDENFLHEVGRNLPNGIIKRVTDPELNSTVIELSGSNIQNNFLFLPKQPEDLVNADQHFSFLTLYIKPISKNMCFEFSVLDSNGIYKRFRLSTLTNIAKVRSNTCNIPLKLDQFWNKITLDLTELTKKCFRSNFQKFARFQINANVFIRKIFLSDQAYTDEKLAKFSEIWQSSKFTVVPASESEELLNDEENRIEKIKENQEFVFPESENTKKQELEINNENIPDNCQKTSSKMFHETKSEFNSIFGSEMNKRSPNTFRDILEFEEISEIKKREMASMESTINDKFNCPEN